jgi:hypothetical protein
MRSVVTPRDAIDAFKRGHPELSSEDVQFLDRLRNERFAPQVATVWSHIRKYRQSAIDDVRVIERAVKALRVAKVLPKVPAESQEGKRKLAAAKKAARVVHDYFAKDHRAEAKNLRRGLAWAEKDFEVFESLCDLDLFGDAGITVALNSEDLPRLSRKYKTLARRTFMVQVRQAMQAIFGRPCNEAVAALTTVAFGVDTSIDGVRSAWRRNRSIRRKI